ncbi:hypothetical protein Tco_0203106, partial [Tanacetum coccineum]
LDDGVAASFQRSQSFNIKIVDFNLPHYQRASKSNKESSIGEIVRLIITACWSRAQVGQESQIKMIQVKEMMQDNNLKNLKSKG